MPRRSKPPVTIAALSLVAAVAAPMADAAVIEHSAGQFDATIAAFDPIGQTFVAEDALLGQIAFAFSRNSNTPSDGLVTMTLYDSSGFAGASLGSTIMDLSGPLPGALDPPQFIDFDFSGIGLTVGNTYTAAVTSNDFSISVVYNGNDGYADGLLLESSPSLTLCTNGCDLNFRVTPAVSAVPLPAAAWLFGSGLLGLLGLARRGKDLA